MGMTYYLPIYKFHHIHEVRVPYITENPLLCPFKVSQFVIKLAMIFEHHRYFACLLYSIARNMCVLIHIMYLVDQAHH